MAVAKKKHRDLTSVDGIHQLHHWSVADEAARLAIPYSAANVGKVCRQADELSFWVLRAVDDWKQIDNAFSAAGLPETLYAEHEVTDENGTTYFGAAFAGYSSYPAQLDHIHKIATGVPVAVGDFNDEGIAGELARADHTHDASHKADKAFTLAGIYSGVASALTIVHAGQLIAVNVATPYTVTVPPSSTEPFDVGSVVTLVQLGTGLLTIAPGAGVTLQTPLTSKARAQFSAITLIKIDTDTWLVSGDLAVV